MIKDLLKFWFKMYIVMKKHKKEKHESYKKMSKTTLSLGLLQEFKEFNRSYPNINEMKKECIDIANFCMMIYSK